MDEKTNQLSERLLDFAANIIKITDALPQTVAGKHIGGQLVKAGTSFLRQSAGEVQIANFALLILQFALIFE